MLYSNEEDVGTNKRLQDNDTQSLHLIVIFILAYYNMHSECLLEKKIICFKNQITATAGTKR